MVEELMIRKMLLTVLFAIVLCSCRGDNGGNGPFPIEPNPGNTVELTSLEVTPVNNIIAINTNLQFTAEGIYSDFSRENLTGFCSWESSNTSVAVFDAVEMGLATAKGTGTTTITASYKEFSSSVPLTAAVEIARGLDKSDAIRLIYNRRFQRLEFVYSLFLGSFSPREIRYASFAQTLNQETSDIIGYGRGNFLSVAINPKTGLLAAAFPGENRELVFAQSNNGSWDIETVYHFSDGLSLAFSPDGDYPAIAFNSTGDYNLYFARKRRSMWIVSNISWNDACLESLCFDPVSGEKCISYKTLGWTGNPSRIYYTGPRWNGFVDGDPENVGDGNSLALDRDGNPHIIYFDNTNRVLKHAYWTDTGWIKEIVDTGVEGTNTSMVITGDNRIYVSYTNTASFERQLNIAGLDTTGWVIETIFISNEIGNWTSLALDEQGGLLLAFIANGNAWILNKR